MTILVIDIGTSGLRAAAVRPDATIAIERYRELLPDTPMAGLVEFDAAVLAAVAVELAREVLAIVGPVEAVGIATQRSSTVVWDPTTGVPVAPALGWQDLRTLGDCLALQADGLHLAPNLSATKIKHLLDLHDPARDRGLLVGTVDTWLVWKLTEGAAHVTDLTNAGVTGLLNKTATDWDPAILDALNIPASMLARIVDSTGHLADATLLDGSPPICGIAGDQQASLLGQGCVRKGDAKITFGTGGMLDLITGTDRPLFTTRGEGGTFPIIARRAGGDVVWGVEAIMLSAGSNVEWLRDDLGLISTAAESHDVASQCDDTEGVVYVPAMLGLGSPYWDYGARSTLLGLTRGSGRPHIVRAVLEGVAQRGADLVQAAEADSGLSIPILRVDGGMSRNATFVQALSDASQRPVEVSPVVEATTLGAAFLAGLAIGMWNEWDELGATWSPSVRVEPGAPLDRERWAKAVERAGRWFGELSDLDF